MRFVTSLPSLLQLAVGILLLSSLNKAFNQTLAQSPYPGTSPMTQTNYSNSAQNDAKLPVGGLFVDAPDGKKQVFPLKHTEVKAKISGNISRVEVIQTFTNPFSKPLEAVYVFPLPDESAVDDMEIQIGDRIIKSQIKKREEAKEIYEKARAEGRTTGLLEQERDNIFTQSIANIKPGENINVKIRYTDSLKFNGGNYEFVFPMVVGPRYIPGANTPGDRRTNQVPDGDRITPPVLKPGTRSGHDINVNVEIDAGLPINNIVSSSHQITTEKDGNLVKVKLANSDTIPNKDLILKYQIVGQNTEATVLSQANSQGGHFALYLIPAIAYKPQEIVPKDVIFLMDTSGSQQGDPLAKCQELMRRFINGLNPNDTFTIIDFANTATMLSEKPLINSLENRQKAINYVDQLDANGGTELMNGINAVLNFPPAQKGRLRSIVLLTDGYIGNENEIINQVQKNLKPGNRLYSFGVGGSVNRFLLNRLAEVGRGTAQIIRQDEPTNEVAAKFFQQINNPVLTDIKISWEGGGNKPEIYPSLPSDLFDNQPLVVFGKKGDRTNGNLKITGTLGNGNTYEKTLAVNFTQPVSARQPEANFELGNESIAQLWGRAKIKDLMNQMFGGETKSGVDAVTEIALNYRLLSQYTAFVAVSEEIRVAPDGTRQRVEVPIEMPEGVSYEGVFGDQQAPAPTAGLVTGSVRGRAVTRSVGAPLPLMAPGLPAPAQPKRVPQTPAITPDVETLSKDDAIAVDHLKVVKIEIVGKGSIPNEKEAIESLQKHLQTLNLSPVTGTTIWSLSIRDGRVERAILDDQLSTIKDQDIIEKIRKLLISWLPSKGINGQIKIELKIGS